MILQKTDFFNETSSLAFQNEIESFLVWIAFALKHYVGPTTERCKKL